MAVTKFPDRRCATWPEVVMTFEGDPALDPFEIHRKELRPPLEDPLGGPHPHAPHPRRRRSRSLK